MPFSPFQLFRPRIKGGNRDGSLNTFLTIFAILMMLLLVWFLGSIVWIIIRETYFSNPDTTTMTTHIFAVAGSSP